MHTEEYLIYHLHCSKLQFNAHCYTYNLKLNIYSVKLQQQMELPQQAGPERRCPTGVGCRGAPFWTGLFVFLCGNPEGGIIPVFLPAWGFSWLC